MPRGTGPKVPSTTNYLLAETDDATAGTEVAAEPADVAVPLPAAEGQVLEAATATLEEQNGAREYEHELPPLLRDQLRMSGEVLECPVAGGSSLGERSPEHLLAADEVIALVEKLNQFEFHTLASEGGFVIPAFRHTLGP